MTSLVNCKSEVSCPDLLLDHNQLLLFDPAPACHPGQTLQSWTSLYTRMYTRSEYAPNLNKNVGCHQGQMGATMELELPEQFMSSYLEMETPNKITQTQL